ncbi:hypothetical protein LRR74_28665, partial [Klebsiella pneumoniae]|nr:hypothetical protein [Klebsiella pneumoniae]
GPDNIPINNKYFAEIAAISTPQSHSAFYLRKNNETNSGISNRTFYCQNADFFSVLVELLWLINQVRKNITFPI